MAKMLRLQRFWKRALHQLRREWRLARKYVDRRRIDIPLLFAVLLCSRSHYLVKDVGQSFKVLLRVGRCIDKLRVLRAHARPDKKARLS